MKKQINTEIQISASPEKIWKILTEFEKYPLWNPFIKFISGEVFAGNKVKVRLEQPGSVGMTIKPKVLAFETNKELRWIGHLLFPGLFDGEHRFELINNGDCTTTFRQSEKFNGILVSFFKKMLDNNTSNGFNQMNKKLKEMAENP